MTTTRHDEEKVERQRQADRAERDRAVGAERDKAGGEDRTRLLDEKPFDFIERTKPEDRLDQTNHPGQQTRDNVNPNIPSVSPDKLGPPHARIPNPGGIVDPKSLGMESQAGVAPPVLPNQPEQWPMRDEATGVAAQAAPKAGEINATDLAVRVPSINEPFGSNVSTGEGGPVELPPLVLTDIDPDSIQVGSAPDFVLTVTGTGFGPNCVVMVDDDDVPTTLVNSTTLTAVVPVAAAADVVDVEVARDEDLSDVLTFEFVAPAGTRSSQKAERKPKKAEPRSKRTKKDKGKGKR